MIGHCQRLIFIVINYQLSTREGYEPRGVKKEQPCWFYHAAACERGGDYREILLGRVEIFFVTHKAA